MNNGKKIILGLIITTLAGVVISVFIQPPYYSGDVFTGKFDVEVLDSDLGPGERYLNENLEARFCVTRGYLHDVGDSDHGLTVEVSNLTRGWGPFAADVKGQENYEQGYVEENGYWIVSASQNAFVRWHLHVPVENLYGRFREENGHLFLWADNDNNEVNGYGPSNAPIATLWNKGDTMKVAVFSMGDVLVMSPEEATIYGVNQTR